MRVGTQEGRTALHYAVNSGWMPVIKCLVEEWHAVITTQDKNGQTPISTAENGHITRVAQYLRAQLKAQMKKMIMEINMLPFYKGVRSIIVKYL